MLARHSTCSPVRLLPLLAGLIALIGFPAVAAAQGGPKLTPQLDSVRAALNKYQDPVLAVHDGYLSTVACMEFSKAITEGELKIPKGSMGVHLLNMGNVGPTLDPMKPQVLIYEPVGDKLQLAAAEWFMPAEAAGGKTPTIFGQALAGPMEGHPPIMPPGLHHYDLHVWLWKENPAGLFAPTNPAVKCEASGYEVDGGSPKMVHSHGM